MNSDIDYIETQIRMMRARTAPWPPHSGAAFRAYTRLESLRTATPPQPVPPPVDAPPVPVGALLFSDEFNGFGINGIDTRKWEGKHFKAPSGTQWDSLNHASLDGNGNLAITSKLVTGQWRSTFMAALASNGYSYKGPRYTEARAKVPAGAGCFAAPIWEWASPWGGGPIEIDVCEQLGKEPGVYHTTVHPWLPGGDKPVGKTIYSGGGYLSADFHVYGAAIHESYVSFYLDGKFVWTADMLGSGLGDLTSYPVVPCIDLDMGGWGGPIDPAMSEATMLVDWIRVWRLA